MILGARYRTVRSSVEIELCLDLLTRQGGDGRRVLLARLDVGLGELGVGCMPQSHKAESIATQAGGVSRGGCKVGLRDALVGAPIGNLQTGQVNMAA